MSTIVWGHGSRTQGDTMTFVPAGTTVKWFSQVDENLLTNNGFLAVDSGDFGTPTDQQGPGDGTKVEIFNYQVFEDLVKRDWVSILHKGDATLAFVGAEVKEGFLCNSVAECKQAGRHVCDGVFGTIHDDEIVILVCRGLPGSDTSTSQYGGDAESVLAETGSDEILEFVQQFMGRVYADPDAAMTEFEGLSEPVKVYLAPWPSIQGFQAAHWGAWYAANGDPESAFRQLNEQAGDETMEDLIQRQDVYRTRFADGAAASPAAFFAQLDAAPGRVQALIGGIGRVQEVRRVWETQTQATAEFQEEGATAWVPTEQELAGTQEINAAALKALDDGDPIGFDVGGIVLLIGDNHAPDWFDWVRSQSDHAAGTITITKGGMFSRGGLEIAGCPPMKQAVVEERIKAFSSKDIEFV